jgi:hypothetical protein
MRWTIALKGYFSRFSSWLLKSLYPLRMVIHVALLLILIPGLLLWTIGQRYEYLAHEVDFVDVVTLPLLAMGSLVLLLSL